MTDNALTFSSSYDEIGDVLYLSWQPTRKDVRYRENDDGLLLRVASTGEVVGVTVEDFGYVWCQRTDELSRLAAEALHADFGAVNMKVQEAAQKAC